MSAATRAWLRGLPKPELHVHLEGTMTPQAYARIARRNGVEVPDDPSALFVCSDFESFLRAFLHAARVLRKPEDFGELAFEYLIAAAADGTRHVELLVSPATQRKFIPDLDLEQLVHAVGDACARAKQQSGISSLLIFDMVRNLGEPDAFDDLELARRCRQYGVVGVGLGGDERNFPARDFQRVFERAAELGFRRTVHAGEAAGPDSVADAIELLHAERIGHGVSARQDKSVMELIRSHGVAIDACPTSNAITGAVRHIGAHPLNDFLNEGLIVTLSSDDPSFFGATLLDEYESLAKQCFSPELLAQLARNGFAASFASDQQKLAWLADLQTYEKNPAT